MVPVGDNSGAMLSALAGATVYHKSWEGVYTQQGTAESPKRPEFSFVDESKMAGASAEVAQLKAELAKARTDWSNLYTEFDALKKKTTEAKAV
jgi:hypothetical protein